MVKRCTNLPARITPSAGQTPAAARGRVEDTDDQDKAESRGGSEKGLNCFVEVVYRTTMLRRDEHGIATEEERVIRRRTVSTETNEFPVFNEQLSLPVFGPGLEPSVAAVNETNNFVTINVFDEVITNRITDLRDKRK